MLKSGLPGSLLLAKRAGIMAQGSGKGGGVVLGGMMNFREKAL